MGITDEGLTITEVAGSPEMSKLSAECRDAVDHSRVGAEGGPPSSDSRSQQRCLRTAPADDDEEEEDSDPW
jgi:hypothetical protein